MTVFRQVDEDVWLRPYLVAAVEASGRGDEWISSIVLHTPYSQAILSRWTVAQIMEVLSK